MLGAIVRTTNGGINWTPLSTGTIQNLYSVWFTDVNNGTAVGDTGTIVRTTNSGTTWTTQTSGTISDLKDVYFSTSLNGIVVGTDGRVIYTTDGGTTWIRQRSGSANTLLGFNFINADMGIAVGTDGTIIRISSGLVSVPISIAPAEVYELENNYPNPFNPSTVISWQSPVGSYQTLKIYDVLGNEVATLVDEFRNAGRYEVTFDATQLSSGVYFYRLQAGSFVETRKMILLK